MRIKFRFQLSEPICLQDRWPIKVDHIIYSFGGELTNVSRKLWLCFLSEENSRWNSLPKLISKGEIKSIRLRHGILLPFILDRLDTVQCTIGMLLPIEIDTDHYVVEFEPENVDEETKIQVKKWGEARRKINSRISFDIAAKGLISDPWPEVERKAAQFYRRGRTAINQRFFVDAFVNYYFFLERLYAGGKFKTSDVKQRLAASSEIQAAFSTLDSGSHADAVACGVLPWNG